MSIVLPVFAAIVFAQAPHPLISHVNSTLDLPDATPLGDGIVDADLNLPGPQITLRAAIMECNAYGGNNLVIVPAGIYRLTILTPPGATDTEATGDLDVKGILQVHSAGSEPDEVIIDAKGLDDRVFQVSGASSRLHLANLVVRNGSTPGDGGGALAEDGATLAPFRTTFTKCRAGGNGGGAAVIGGKLSMQESVFSKNVAGIDGGGLALANCEVIEFIESQFVSNHAEDDGGGLDASAGPTWVAILRCTFSRNTAKHQGGGIQISTIDSLMSNCTFDRNEAFGAGGGAVSYFGGGNHDWWSCTLARNRAKQGSGIRENVSEGGATSIEMVNTIMANGKKTNYFGDGLISLGHNIDTGATCGFTGPGDMQHTDPRLAKKPKDNGGPTPTLALKPDSPAIDAGHDFWALPTDQRLLFRVDQLGLGESLADIGSFEVQ